MLRRLKAYIGLMRLNRPWPIFLILFPTFWGLFLGPKVPSLFEIVIFTAGILLTRSAGCVINDYFDRAIDGQVSRTKRRPLQVGAIRNFEAVLLFLVLMFIAFVLLLFLKPAVIVLGFVAFLLALFYPLAKRFTYFPQGVLGVAFNFGLIMATLQVNDKVSALAWAYYAFAILWTIHYDTLYALADYADDLRIGVKSIPTFFKAQVYLFLSLTAALCVIGLGLIWLATGFSSLRLILFSGVVLLFMYQHVILLAQKESAGLRLFKQQVWIGLLILIGVLC